MDLEHALIFSMTYNENQQDALDYLNKITEDPSNFPEVADLFFRTQNEGSRKLLSFIAYRLLDNFWSSIDQQLINDFRDQIIDLFFNNELSNELSKSIEMIISNIAFNLWPEVWPNFIGELLTIVDDIGNVNNIAKFFHILENLVSSFSTSIHISLARRNLLIQELQFKIPDIISLLQSISFDQVVNTDIGQSFISFINLYCSLNLDDEQIFFNLADFLITNFAPFYPATFPVLKELISKDRISLDIFNLAIENIISLMEKSFSDPKEFISFISHIIKESLTLLPQCCSDPNFQNTIRSILEYTLTFSSKTDFCEDLWSLWSLLLNTYASDLEHRTSAVCLILEPILPNILESLFEYLPTTMSQSRLLSFQPKSCIIAFSMIDEDNLISFLSEKPLSSSLLICLGIIYFLDDNELFESIVGNVFSALLSDHFTDDLNASLFVISRNTPFLISHLDALEAVFTIFTEMLESGDYPTIQTFLLALNHIASSIPDIVVKHCPNFIIFCLENVVDPTKLHREDFLRICRIMSKFVASTETIEDQRQLSEILTSPVCQLLEDEEQKNILLGCEAVNALASISNFTVTITMEFLWDSLAAALNNLKNSEVFSIACDSFSTTIRTCSFDKCDEIVQSFMEFCQTVEDQDCAILHTFSQIKLCHNDVEVYRQMLIDTYIQKIVNEETLTVEFFEFFDAFEILEEEQGIVVPAACEGIRCNDSNISKSAAKLLLKYFKIYIEPFKIQCEGEIIMAIFDALFDQIHHRCMKKLLKLLHQVVDKMCKRQLPFEQIIFDAIQNRICDDDFTQKTVLALKNSLAKDGMFIELVENLLIAAGRANPNEFQMLSDVVCTRSKVKIRGIFQNEDEIGKC